MTESVHDKVFKDFCKVHPLLAAKVTDYRPWGSESIVIWLETGFTYKVKRTAPDRFAVQSISKLDIIKKFVLN